MIIRSNTDTSNYYFSGVFFIRKTLYCLILLLIKYANWNGICLFAKEFLFEVHLCLCLILEWASGTGVFSFCEMCNHAFEDASLERPLRHWDIETMDFILRVWSEIRPTGNLGTSGILSGGMGVSPVPPLEPVSTVLRLSCATKPLLFLLLQVPPFTETSETSLQLKPCWWW